MLQLIRVREAVLFARKALRLIRFYRHYLDNTSINTGFAIELLIFNIAEIPSGRS